MKICIWRYKDNTRNYPGYHLSADVEGCRELRQRLSHIRDSVVFTLTAPDADVLAIPNNQGGSASFFAGRKFQIQTSSTLPPATFRWEEQDTTLILTCSRDQMDRFLAGVSDIEKGEGDYRIGDNKDHALWLWWQVTKSK